MGDARVWTIGYEGRIPETLIAELKAVGVDLLVDVRERALSRRPGFSKTALMTEVERAGIEYWNPRELGVPKPIRDPYKRGGPFDVFAAAYEEHLSTQLASIDTLEGRVKARKAALLCLEADHTRCHRDLLSAHLADRGLDIVHL